MYGIPRWLVIAAIVAAVLIEGVFRIPDIMLIKERFEAQRAQFYGQVLQSTTLLNAQIEKAEAEAARAKDDATTAKFAAQAAALQPQLAAAQLAKANSDAITASFTSIAAKYQPDMTLAQLTTAQNDGEASKLKPQLTQQQLEKAEADVQIAVYGAIAAHLQPETVTAQLTKAQNDAKASQYQPETAAAQLEKTKQEALASIYQTKLNIFQAAKLALEAQTILANLKVIQQGAALSNFVLSIVNGVIGIPDPADNTAPQAAARPSSPRPAAPPAPPPNPNLARVKQVMNDALYASHDCRKMSAVIDAADRMDYRGVSASDERDAHTMFQGILQEYNAECRRR